MLCVVFGAGSGDRVSALGPRTLARALGGRRLRPQSSGAERLRECPAVSALSRLPSPTRAPVRCVETRGGTYKTDILVYIRAHSDERSVHSSPKYPVSPIARRHCPHGAHTHQKRERETLGKTQYDARTRTRAKTRTIAPDH